MSGSRAVRRPMGPVAGAGLNPAAGTRPHLQAGICIQVFRGNAKDY